MKDITFVSLDLEMNQPSGRVIEVGIVFGSPAVPRDQWDKRTWFVDPREPIADRIVELTSISDWHVANQATPQDQIALEINDLMEQIRSGATNFPPLLIENPVVWGHGDDVALKTMFRESNTEFKRFGYRHIDVKTIHQFKCFATGRNFKGGLKSAMGAYKLQFEGRPHRAHDDAFNTLRLFVRLLEEQNAYSNVQSIMKNLVSPC